MKTLFAQRPRFKLWETVLAVVLVVSYFTLMGETIHCQYFLHGYEEHHHTTSRTVHHTTHCLMANHDSMVGIYSVLSFSFNPLQLLNLELILDPESAGFSIIAANPTRAPPSVSAIV